MFPAHQANFAGRMLSPLIHIADHPEQSTLLNRGRQAPALSISNPNPFHHTEAEKTAEERDDVLQTIHPEKKEDS